MKRKIIRCKSENPSIPYMHLPPSWIVRYLMNPVWLAEHYLTPDALTFDEYGFGSIRIRVDVFKRQDRLELIDQSVTLAKYYFSEFPYRVSSSLSFSSEWTHVEGVKNIHIYGYLREGQYDTVSADGCEDVKAAVKCLIAFAPGWFLEKDDKIVVALEGGNRSDLHQHRIAQAKFYDELMSDSPDSSQDWHPSHEGIGPGGLTDDERDVYYGL